MVQRRRRLGYLQRWADRGGSVRYRRLHPSSLRRYPSLQWGNNLRVRIRRGLLLSVTNGNLQVVKPSASGGARLLEGLTLCAGECRDIEERPQS